MSDIDIITVRWDAERDVYKVNRPNWSGGEVVLWSAVKTMLASQAAEVARLRAGGCARDQRTTQYCAEAQAALARVEAAEKDAARYRWLTSDHDDPWVRQHCREILERMGVMSYSATSAAIDTALEIEQFHAIDAAMEGGK